MTGIDTDRIRLHPCHVWLIMPEVQAVRREV
jgi:hypothetical protein